MAPKERLSPQLLTTADGSLTYLHPVHGASYRSVKGAATESRWVFLEGSRLRQRLDSWSVLELGFGTGLNFQLTADVAREAGVELTYVAMEPEPMPAENWLIEEPFKALTFGEPLLLDGVNLTVHRSTWQGFSPPQAKFDAVYHDPFGPAVAPDCWSVETFAWARKALRRHGVLATYGASSAARRAMAQAGLYVGVLPGAPGKREMTVASSCPEAIAHARAWKRSEHPL